MNMVVKAEPFRVRLPLPSPKLSSGVMQAVVMHALQLRRAYREVFVLCDIQGRTIADTAEILGVSPKTVVARLERARRQMGDVTKRLCQPKNPKEDLAAGGRDKGFHRPPELPFPGSGGVRVMASAG